MKRSKLIVACVLGIILVVGWVSLGMAGEQRQAPIHQYTGQIPSITIDTCGLQPGTWIQRGAHLVRIDELGVGNYITAQATLLPAEARRPGTVGSNIGERALTLQEASGP
jgi:hypothetical protein